MAYIQSQLILYRVFLHYLRKSPNGTSSDKRAIGYANLCGKYAFRAIAVSMDHQRQGLLCPASWHSLYTIFLAIVCLLFAHASLNEGQHEKKAHGDIINGIRLLASTACTDDTGSVRCLNILKVGQLQIVLYLQC